MSVSQVKKRFAEMESYLGRDTEALRKLKLLKDDVNLLRTSLATAEEKADRAEAIKNAARKRADDAEMESHRLRAENDKLIMQLKTLEAQVLASRSKASDTEQEEDESELSEELPFGHDSVECKKLLKALRRSLPQCPKLTSKKSEGTCPSFIRQDFSQGWSHKSIWVLGASVAIIAAHEGGVTIVDPIGTAMGGSGVVPPHRDGMLINFVRWFGRNFKQRTGPPKRVYFGNAGKRAELVDPHDDDKF